MARRAFDANFSRRPAGGGSQSQYSLMGEPSGGSASYGQVAQRRSYDDYGEEPYSSQTSGDYEDVYKQQEDQYDRIPRDGGQRSTNDYGNVAGGWRQRSPSPRFSNNRSEDSERVSRIRGVQEPQWSRPDQSGRDIYQDRLDLEVKQGQFQQSNPFSIQNSGAGILRNPLGSNQGLMGHQDQPVVMVLPHGQGSGAGGLMGNMGLGMVQAGNPFGVLAQQKPMQVIMGNLPSFNGSTFGQQIIQQTPVYGQGVGEQPLNIYGPQTQQGFNRFEGQQQRADYSDDRRSSRNDRSTGSTGGNRRSDSRTPLATKPSVGTGRNDPSSRKRNLVLRDPRPEEVGDRKRARTSGGTRGNRGGGKGANNRQSGGKPTQVKRISLGEEKNVKDNRYKRKSDFDKSKAKKAVVVDATGKKEEDGTQAPSGDSKTANGEGKKEKKDRKTKYDEFPTSILVCKVCQKVMNDGASFESHLSGRAHVSLMKILEERFTKRSELLMIESKCAEEEIGIEMERQRRAGKGGRPEKNSNNYCKMCDCNYVVNWGTHKVSLGHRVLKEFLHPTCRFCKSHFMHRIDWVTHMLSHSHLGRIHELKTEGTTPLGEQESPSQDELFAINMELARDERPTNAITIRSLDGKESLTEEMKEILKNDRGEIVLPKGEIPIPQDYDENVEIGEESIVGVSGSRCRVCRVYIADDKDVEGHCKTREHFNMYVSFLKRVVRHREHKEEERVAAEEKAKKEEEKKQKDAEKAAKKKSMELSSVEKLQDKKLEDSVENSENNGSAMEVEECENSVIGQETLENGEKKESTEELENPDEGGVVLLDEVGEDAEGDEIGEEVEGDEVGEEAEKVTIDEEAEKVAIDEEAEKVTVDKDAEGNKLETSIQNQVEKNETEIGNVDIKNSKESEKTLEDNNGNGDVEMAEKDGQPADTETITPEDLEKIKSIQAVEAFVTETFAIEDEHERELRSTMEQQQQEEPTDVVVPIEKEEVSIPAAPEVPVSPTKAQPSKGTSPQTATRGSRGGTGRGGPSRGTPARGGGGPIRGTPVRGGGGGGAQALRNVTPRVDTNYRGGSNVRGQGRGGGGNRPLRGSPRGGGRGGRGRPPPYR